MYLKFVKPLLLSKLIFQKIGQNEWTGKCLSFHFQDCFLIFTLIFITLFFRKKLRKRAFLKLLCWASRSHRSLSKQE